MSTIELCKKFFGKSDFYELLEIAKDAEMKEVKKAYYKLSLQVHPDRVSDEDKSEATEKFKVLSKVYQILTDDNKRALYDEQGIVEDDDDEFDSKLTNWMDLWRKIFQPLTMDDITNHEKSYVGSELERADIKKSYLSAKGDINLMMNAVPFLKVEDEPRLDQIVREMIEAKEVPEYKAFTEENKAKRKRRHQKYARESKLAEKQLNNMLWGEDASGGEVKGHADLTKAILEKKKSHGNFDSFMAKLEQKYCGEDDSEAIDIKTLGKSKKRAVAGKKSSKKEAELHSTKTGKVKKRKI